MRFSNRNQSDFVEQKPPQLKFGRFCVKYTIEKIVGEDVFFPRNGKRYIFITYDDTGISLRHLRRSSVTQQNSDIFRVYFLNRNTFITLRKLKPTVDLARFESLYTEVTRQLAFSCGSLWTRVASSLGVYSGCVLSPRQNEKRDFYKFYGRFDVCFVIFREPLLFFVKPDIIRPDYI